MGEALGYFASAIFLWRTKVSEQAQPKADRRPLVVEIKEGLVFVAKHALLRRIVICTASSNFFGNISATLLPILVLRHLDLGAAGLGIVLSVGAVGGLLGAIAVPRLAGWVGEGPLIPISSIAFSLALLLVPLSATLSGRGLQLSVLIVGEFISSFGILAYNVMQVSMRQRVCPPKLLGRMNASIRFVIFGVMPIAGILSGLLGSWLGLLPTIWIGVLGGLLAPVAVVFSPLWQMRKLPDSVDYSAASV
ncbi:spectinomycin-efflux protein [Renibacterium salmoninarum ATCC 33209]|uniref:Spectinomycin-efflux protein n=1 Tax=Renibacterium salmoninarum (strain ATCC 33209 / DSM 20767 / JCM 11484 / NBRC 15589 / NCIMB 2235) TaxID=288705 RepID=A9WPA5_RENSM|nr:spectinomycin-efflux protein [Renibacterium salmoninarum ATCC 33209]